MKWTRILGGVCCALVLATSAGAQSPKEQARAFFKQGREHYVNEHFARALDAFEQANALMPHPLMVFNIAQVYQAMNDLPNAVEQFKRYLATHPKDAAEVSKEVAALEKKLARWASVRIDSSPPGAEIRVAKKSHPARGTAPTTLRLPPGRLKLYLRLKGYESVRRPIELKPGQQAQLTVVMPPILPAVVVKSVPPGARVRVGQAVARGRTPVVHRLPAGHHTLVIELAGYEPLERPIDLLASHTMARPLTVQVTLHKAVPKGSLALEVEPDGAKVFIDGKLVGTAPFAEPLQVAAGPHRIEARAPGGGAPYQEVVTIVAGQTTETSFEVDTGPSLPSVNMKTVAWITMGVGGALMAGGAVTGLMANSASGDLDTCRGDPGCERTEREVSLADDVKSRALVTDVLLFSGVAAVAAGGAALYFFLDDGPVTGPPAITVAPTQGGLTAVGTFQF